MAKLKITSAFRTRLSEKLMDLGNFVAVGLVISQFAFEKDFSMSSLIIGIIGTVIIYFAGYAISP